MKDVLIRSTTRVIVPALFMINNRYLSLCLLWVQHGRQANYTWHLSTGHIKVGCNGRRRPYHTLQGRMVIYQQEDRARQELLPVSGLDNSYCLGQG
jgi:hypothetical protein